MHPGNGESRQTASARMDHFRRRRKASLVKPLLGTLVAAGLLAVVAFYGMEHLTRSGALAKLQKRSAAPRDRVVGLGRGFHVLEDGYWAVFDDPALLARPATTAPRAAPGEPAIDAEGLTVRPMKNRGPWYIVSDMGGLVPSAVGIWVSPNQLGQGTEAFWAEPGEELEVTHWAKNLTGFKVYRVLNKHKRTGPGNKMHEAGWILGQLLADRDGDPIK